jgi:hypothetical protein
MNKQQWYGSVELVKSSINNITTEDKPTTMEIETTGSSGEISTVLMIEANTTSSTHKNSSIDNDEPNSPLTIDCDYVSNIENRKDDENKKGSSWLRVTTI